MKYIFHEDIFSNMFCLVYFCLVLNKTTAATSRVYPLPNNVCSAARLAARPHAWRPCARQPRGCQLPFQLSRSPANTDPQSESSSPTAGLIDLEHQIVALALLFMVVVLCVATTLSLEATVQRAG